MIKRSNGPADTVKVTFVVSAEQCDQPVSVVGDFNDWDPLATPLRKRSNGTRSATVDLPPGGSYRFKYLADGGSWFCDPDADSVADEEIAAADSLLVV
jgi:1,4-alpha-glucan branching enzyme